MAENTEHTAETSIPFADDDADGDKDNIDATGQGKCLEHQDQTDSPVSNRKASVQQESPTKNGRKPEGDNASSANKLSSLYCFSEQKATGRSLVSHTTSSSNLQLSKELNKNVNPIPSRSHLPVTERADTTCDDVSRSNAEKENRDSDQSQDSKFYHNDFQHSAFGGENTSLTGKNLPEVGEQPVRKPSVHGEEILNAMNQNQHIKKLASEAEKIRGGNAGTVETSTDKEGLMESLSVNMGNLTITEMEAAGEGSGNTTQAAVHETKMDNGEIITERKVSPFLDVIIEYAKQQKKTDNLFPGVEVSFQNQGSDLWCTLTRKENVPESICNEILNLDSNYGTRDVKFSDIDILSMVVNKERMIEALLAEIRLKENFHGKVDSVSQKIFIVASGQPKADSIYFKIKKGLSMKTFALHGEMKQKLYVEKLINAIENASSGKVEGKLDSCGMIIKIVGVQSSVETAVTDFKPVAETCVVTCPDIIKFIERKFGKATAMSDGNLVQVESQAENEKTVFVLHGPSEQVSCLHKNIEALKVACAVKIVNITDTEMLSYLTNNAGDEFLNNLTTRHDVIVEKNEVAKEALSDVLLEKTHTFSVGHKVSLARFLPDYLQKEPKVTFQAYEDSEHQVDMNSEETVTVTIPKYNEGKTKEKSNFEESMKKLIKWMEKNSVTKISLCLEKTGGWPFGKLVKSVLYGLKNYMDKALSVPSSVCLFPDDVTNYEEVEKAFDGAFSDTTFDNSHFEDNASQDGLKVDVWNTDLLDKQADVLVCPVHPELDLKEGVISAHLLARAGPKLQDELIRNACKKKLKPWEFVCTEGYDSPYKYILHGALEKRKDKQSDKAIQNFIYRCLQKAHELEAASIVFPALGTGRCEYRPEYIAAAIYEAAMFFEMNNPATVLKEVNIASNHDATVSVMCPQLQTRHCSNLMKVGRVLVRVMLVKMGLTAVMADSVTVFWEKGNRSKRDKIYDGDNDKMIKIRYSGDEVNLEPAFQDGIREANRHRCQSCILYFRKTDAMMSYKEKTVQHLLKAIENLSEELSYIRCIAVVFEDDELSLLHWFERNCKASASAATVQQITETKKLSTVQRVVKFIGHPKNVEEAVKEFEDISAQLQGEAAYLSNNQEDQDGPGSIL